MSALLEMRGVARSFGGFEVLRGVELTLAAGQIRFLIGPNGAGKSTLFKLITGFEVCDRGEILIAGQRVEHWPGYRRQRLGLAQSFQTPRLIAPLTVAENLLLSLNPWRGQLARFWRSDYPPAALQQVRALLCRLGLDSLAEAPAGSLPHGKRKLLDLGAALIQAPALLLLDEPTAGLMPDDIEVIEGVIRELKGKVAALIIEHDTGFVRRLAEPVVVLHEGRVIREGNIASLEADPLIQEIYFGRHRT